MKFLSGFLFTLLFAVLSHGQSPAYCQGSLTARFSPTVASQCQLGKTAKHAQVTYDVDIQGGTAGTINLPLILPDNAIITGVWTDEVTNIVSASVSTIALGLATTTDVLDTTAITDVTGIQEAIPKVETSTTFIKLSGATRLTITIGSSDLTAGKVTIFLDYLLSN